MFSSISVLLVAISVAIYFAVAVPIYNLYFSPLRKYPGPALWAASVLPWGYAFKSGNFHDEILKLHERYGHIVRVGPNELSFDCPEAWEDVYGRGSTRKENAKPTWYLSPKRNEIVGAKEQDHKRMRKLLSVGFTGAAMLQQEPMIKKNVDLLIRRLRETCQHSVSDINLFDWFSYCTFDIIGDLSFGESFGCLNDSMVRVWLSMVFANVMLLHNLVLCNRIPFFAVYLPILKIWQLWRGSGEFDKTIEELITKRLRRESQHDDFVENMKSKKGTAYMTDVELYKNAAFLTLAGSETTSTVMTTVIFMIESHAGVKTKLLDELHSVFTAEHQINMRSATELPYLMAVIEESMRLHPPGPNSLWRITPPEGNVILGDFIPGKTILGIPHRAVYRSEHNFRRANDFIPERWLRTEKSSEFIDDRKDGFHPFSYGQRQCLAINLAYAEMRYILARVLWNFDVQLTAQSKNWTHGMKSGLIWEKRPLFVRLTDRQG